VHRVLNAFYVLLGRTFVSGLCTKNLKNLKKTFFKKLGFFPALLRAKCIAFGANEPLGGAYVFQRFD